MENGHKRWEESIAREIERARRNGIKKYMSDKIENDHSQKDSTEPLQENMTKDAPEQDVNNNEKEEELSLIHI